MKRRIFFCCIVFLAAMAALSTTFWFAAETHASVFVQGLPGSALSLPKGLNNLPTVNAITPETAPNDLDTPVVISGANFATVLSGTQVITPPLAYLGDIELDDLVWVNTTTLSATLPWGLDPGVYTLTVINPDGGAGALPNAFTVTQGLGVWTTGGPYGGPVHSLAIDPITPTTLYAGVASFGLFRSQDGGDNWEVVMPGLSPFVEVSTVSPNTVYLASWERGLYRSDDGGDTWNAIPIAGTQGSSRLYPHPTISNTVYATVDCELACGGLFKSENRGQDWTQLTNGLTDTRTTALAINPADLQTLYLGTSNGNVFRSQDGGDSWEFIGQPDNYIVQLAVDPFGAHEVWACGADGGGHWGNLWKYVAGSWNQITPGTGGQNEGNVLVFDPVISGTLWLGTLQGGFKSIDGGENWSVFGGETRHVTALVVDPTETAIVYQGYNGEGIAKTVDDGITWLPVNHNLTGIVPNGLAPIPGDPASVYATVHGSGIFKTNNGGQSWLGLPSDNKVPRTPVVDPITPTRLYIGRGSGVDITEDDGLSWHSAQPQPPPQYADCCRTELLALVATGQPGRMVIGAGFMENDSVAFELIGGGIYTSTDFGETWGFVDVGQEISPVTALAVDPHNPLVIYAGTGGAGAGTGRGNGIWMSQDGGSSWSFSGLPDLEVLGIVVDTSDSQTVYAVAADGFYVSHDAGQTWILVTQEIWGNTGDLLHIPTQPAVLYAYGWGGMLRSTDGGYHWSRAAGTWGYANIASMAFAMAEGRAILYVGIAGGGGMGLSERSLSAYLVDEYLNPGVYRLTTVLSPPRLFLPLVVH